MWLLWLILSLTVGGFLAWISGRWGSKLWPRWISLVTLFLHLATLIYLWVRYLGHGFAIGVQGPWIDELHVHWVPQLGIDLFLAMDGISLLLIVLVNLLGILAVAASWEGIQYRVGFFHFNLLWILAAIIGVFLAFDLFLFYFFWEMMLIPLYLLIGIWGHEQRVYATIKFFIFTQGSSLLMLLSIVGLYWIHGRDTGVWTFNYLELVGTHMSVPTALLLMLGFLVAFGVKLPLVPFHTWLPDAHSQAPTAGSVDLAGLVLKVGGYGFLRFLVPLFPDAALVAAPYVMALGVAGILWGSIVAFGQTDLKRLIAYTSIGHMGFVAIGIFAWNQLALQGALFVMLSHGISTGALFILSGDLGDRLGHRDMERMGGFWTRMPRMGGFGMVLAMASLGLPGLGNFVGEILVLLGTWRVNPVIASLATLGFIVSTVYSLWLIQKVFFGPRVPETRKLRDSNAREILILGSACLILLWFGLYPGPTLRTARDGLQQMQVHADISRRALLRSETGPP